MNAYAERLLQNIIKCSRLFSGYGSKWHSIREKRNKIKEAFPSVTVKTQQAEDSFPNGALLSWSKPWCVNIAAFNHRVLFSFRAADLPEVSENCSLRTSLVSYWKRTNSLLLKQAQGFSRSQRERLGFQRRDRSGRTFGGEGGGERLPLDASPLAGGSTRWLAVFTRQQDPFCESFPG